MGMKIVSWNVNGLLARRRDFIKLMNVMKPDIMCVQEINTKCELDTPGYFQYWNLAKRRGYSGTLTLARKEPASVKLGMGIKKYDEEGRFIALEYKDYYVINVYVPSTHPNNAPERPDYRRGWDRALRKYVSKLSKPAILCGDFNVARAWIDSYPENHEKEGTRHGKRKGCVRDTFVCSEPGRIHHHTGWRRLGWPGTGGTA